MLHFHRKCISNWSFNSESHFVIKIEINCSWSLSDIFVSRVDIQNQNYLNLVFV